ncbi:MAG TPA: FkbM family methyltransferase [Tepidisphaeraceae bacterium]|jgi:FkbM family methyltransferase
MLGRLHRILTHNRVTSRMQRRLVHSVKSVLNVPDAYYSMGQLYRKIHPVAVLDIGAHHGYTVDKMLDYAPGAKIHAFEPTPESASVLRRRLTGRQNVHVHEMALGDKTGTVSFHINVGEQTNSLLDNPPPGQTPYEKAQEHLAAVQVQAMTLDDWAARFEPTGWLMIKADIQGAERLLVSGGRKTFAQRVACFYTEICLLPLYENQTTFWELHTILTQELGLALFDIYPCGKDDVGRAAFTDAMWVHPSVLPISNHK